MKQEEEILICDNHQREYPTPLIGTMAFIYCELWCPYCGGRWGAFDAGQSVPVTQELQQRHDAYKERYKEYLHAQALTYASLTKWDGNMIKPADLPQEEKDRLKLIRDNDWRQEIKIEEIPV